MEMRQQKDAGGAVLHFKYFDGIYFPPNVIGDVKTHLDAIKNLKHKDGDVLLDTFPKTGTHWTFEIMHMLVTGKAEYYPEKTLALEFEPIEKLDNLESPRVHTSHLFPQHIPQSLIDNKSKMVYVFRNPKDTAVSMHSFMKILNVELLQGYESTWDNYIESYMNDKVPYNSWCEHVKAWLDFQKSHPGLSILFIAFEDMKKDLRRSVQKIAEHLELKHSPEFLDKVAEKCQFINMSKGKTCAEETKMGVGGKNPFYRKGDVGDWKNYFTVAQNERFDVFLKENMADIDLDIKYTL
ncbi:sulfotransferase 1B1-like [Ylistrum balloti]|uniref:sulfotransferase 1B1-like n=1 Tax=Ylistrum balloti TaxID=509963 RepID=UPI002905C329|nr:sulfotransferase 1B1-like [Ylistrum balloti]